MRSAPSRAGDGGGGSGCPEDGASVMLGMLTDRVHVQLRMLTARATTSPIVSSAVSACALISHLAVGVSGGWPTRPPPNGPRPPGVGSSAERENPGGAGVPAPAPAVRHGPAASTT